MIDYEKSIEALVDKAADAQDSGDAMRFSQAAGNIANAKVTMAYAAKEEAASGEADHGSAG